MPPPIRHHISDLIGLTALPFKTLPERLASGANQYAPRPLALDLDADPMTVWANQALAELTKPGPTWAEHIASLDIRAGDRVRLTQAGRVPLTSPKHARRAAVTDASVLEGVVEEIRNRRTMGLAIRIKGFAHTGPANGGVNVWFPLTDYVVEVLHRTYRWSDRDHVIAELVRLRESEWEGLSPSAIKSYRERHGARADRILKRLGHQLPESPAAEG